MFQDGIKLLGAIALAFICSPSFADDNSDGQTKAKIEDVKVKPANTDADDILTNAKLRAESGSTSKFSVASSLSYNGGSISHPFGDTRTNIQNVNGQSPVADLEGGLNIKYNISKLDSLLLGETIRWVTPLSSTSKTPQDYRGTKMDSYNPGLTYQRIYKLSALQSYVQVGPTIYTQTDYTSIGYLGNMTVYNVNAYDIGTSRFTVGLETEAMYNWFRNPRDYPELGMSADDVRSASSDYVLAAFPYLEYKINDMLNLRTVCMWFQVEHTLARPEYNVWVKDTAMQSVGLGISVTRDIFLYPNVQFIPDQLRAKQTNVALSTNINLF